MKKFVCVLAAVICMLSMCACGIDVNVSGLGDVLDNLTSDTDSAQSGVEGSVEDSDADSGNSSGLIGMFGQNGQSGQKTAVDFIGKWRSVNQVDKDGNVRYLYLILKDDGYASYWYCNPLKINNSIVAFYEGTWELTAGSDDAATVSLKLDQVGGTSANAPEVPKLNGKFEITYSIDDDTKNTIVVANKKGEPLLKGLEGSWSEFSRYDSDDMTEYITRTCKDTNAKAVLEFLNSGGVNGILNERFTSVFDGEISLSNVVYQLKDDTVDEKKLYEHIQSNGYELMTSVTYASSKTLDDLLIDATGYGLNDCMWNMEGLQYDADLDVYYVEHGDTNAIIFDDDVTIYEDYVTVKCTPYYTFDETPFVVTLERNALGNFRILSIVKASDAQPPQESGAVSSGKTISTDYLEVTLPDTWTDDVCLAMAHLNDKKAQWLEFVEEPDYSDFGGGWLCSVVQMKGNNASDYDEFMSYDYLGELRCSNGDKYGVVVVYPTDVQPSMEQMKVYQKLYQDIDSMLASIKGINGAVFYKGEGGSLEYIIPGSDVFYLTEADIIGLTKDELRIARNEIYARHGRRFNDKALQAHFDSCSWYNGTIEPKDFDDSVLSDCEIKNINFIKKYENAAG